MPFMKAVSVCKVMCLEKLSPAHIYVVQIACLFLLVQVARERLTQLLFEHNNAASLLVCDSPVLSLFAMGKLSGCVVDLGHDKTGNLQRNLDYCVTSGFLCQQDLLLKQFFDVSHAPETIIRLLLALAIRETLVITGEFGS